MADIELSTAPSETVIDPLNDYVPMVDVSETPDGINKLLLRYLRQVEIGVALSDETTNLSTGTAKVTFRMPYSMTLTAVKASVGTAPTGAAVIVDINESGSSILSTKLSIDATEKTSASAASAAVISDPVLADDAEITMDIDQVGSTVPGAGLKVWLIGYRT